jgi:hypothetical protein
VWTAALHGHAAHVAVAVLVALVAVDAGLILQRDRPSVSYPVRVTEVDWQFFLENVSTGPGFGARSGQDVNLTLEVTDTCGECGVPLHFSKAFVNTTGFELLSWSLPPIDVGATGNLTVMVAMPNGTYSGPVSIDLA